MDELWSPESQNQMQSCFFLNVIVRNRSPVLKLFSTIYKPLLVWWNALFSGKKENG